MSKVVINKRKANMDGSLEFLPKNRIAANAAIGAAKRTEPPPPKYDMVKIIARHPNAPPARSKA